MLRLSKLYITDDKPLYVSFIKTDKEIIGDYEKSAEGMSVRKKEFLVQDKEIINQLLSYFFRNCDSDKSPQNLCEIKNDIKYKSLIKDYRPTDKELFCDIVENIFKIMKENNTIDINQISKIKISYPENWKVDYEKSKTHNLKNIII